MKKQLLIGLSSTFLLAMSANAADINAGKQLSGRCSSCHGQTGVSSNPLYPNLAGQKAPYLLKQMRDFQQGKRIDPTMQAMVKGLSEQDMDNLAEFYSRIK